MNYHDFRTLVYKHLGGYKFNILEIEENGIFNYRGKDITKAHILPIKLREMNILDKYRTQFFTSDHSNIDFHKFFHHLNSSQALCINLFFPLIAESTHELFLNYLKLDNRPIVQSQFEKESDIEIAKRRTSFDYYVQLAEEIAIYVEVKYTEDGFAQAKFDEYHQKKFRDTYVPLLAKKAEYIAPQCLDEKVFLEYYQLLRNLIHISDMNYVVLLFPYANTKVSEQSIYARDHLLTPLGREKLKIVYLEEFITYLEAECIGSPLEDYYRDFRAKYLPQANDHESSLS